MMIESPLGLNIVAEYGIWYNHPTRYGQDG